MLKRIQKRRVCSVIAATLLVLGSTLPCAPLSGQSIAAPVTPTHASGAAAGPERQKAALADAERLLALATQLKTAVDKSRKDELSLQVIRNADEIEKLAKTAKGRIQ